MSSWRLCKVVGHLTCLLNAAVCPKCTGRDRERSCRCAFRSLRTKGCRERLLNRRLLGWFHHNFAFCEVPGRSWWVARAPLSCTPQGDETLEPWLFWPWDHNRRSQGNKLWVAGVLGERMYCEFTLARNSAVSLAQHFTISLCRKWQCFLSRRI